MYKSDNDNENINAQETDTFILSVIHSDMCKLEPYHKLWINNSTVIVIVKNSTNIGLKQPIGLSLIGDLMGTGYS